MLSMEARVRALIDKFCKVVGTLCTFTSSIFRANKNVYMG